MKELGEEREVVGVFPYLRPSGRRGVTVKGEFKDITVLTGPSSSGKSSLLEAFAWSEFPPLPPEDSALELLLLENMKPRRRLPIYAFSRSSGGISTLYVEALGISAVQKMISKLLEGMKELGAQEKLPTSFWEDVSIASSFLAYFEGPDMGAIGLIRRAVVERTLDTFFDMIEEILGKNFSWGYWKIYGVEPEVEAKAVGIEEFFRRAISSKKKMMVGLAYSFEGGKWRKSIVLSLPSEILSMKQEGKWEEKRVLAFHPYFISHSGILEAIYSKYAEEGIERESEAIDILRREFEWVGGFELLGKELHLKSEGHGGKRLPLYSLSDGCRSLSSLALLYALSSPRALVLVDSPEAYLDFKGKKLAAEILARMAELRSRVIVATKSQKLISELERACKKMGIQEEMKVIEREQVERRRVVFWNF